MSLPDLQVKDVLHQKMIAHYDSIKSWFAEKSQDFVFPFYSSFDLRDSSVKVSPVDANLFPAGFNNICEVDRERAVELCEAYLKEHFPSIRRIILLAEEHTHNPFYWDNVYSLKVLLEQSGVSSVYVCVPGKNIKEDMTIISARGYSIEVFLLKNKVDKGELIISNNDFSVDYQLDLSVPVTPPVSAGWSTRRKHSFFEKYNLLAREFADLIQVEPEYLTIKTEKFTNFQINDSECLKKLKEKVDLFLSELEPIYRKILYKEKNRQKPFLFLKNNAGTYGLGMTTITSSQDIENWNYKIKKKMKATKGGGGVTELIIQEGIASDLQKEGFVAEPVVYLIGHRITGGFLRTHKKKGVRDNLNSPGAVYRTLCISDLEIEVEGKPMENVYGWIAHLGGLALAYELQAIKKENIQGIDDSRILS
ncbi:MAG: glutamate--cysteine ligase [Bdellovibrionales bacterium]|nr:glutamate--cysteine ligase [Bdellovibrionales bacterium]